MRFAAVTIAIFFGTGIHETGFADDRRIELEVLTSSKAPIEATHEWLQVLKQLKIDQVRMRSKRAGDVAPTIQGNTPNSRTVRVTAVLTSDNRLSVPGASFRRANSAEMRAWLQNLRSPQQTGQESPAVASPAELVRLRKKLSERVAVATEGVSILEFVAATGDWGVPILVDRTVRFQRNDGIHSELKGLTRGTALAIAVREHGAVVAPEPGGSSLKIAAMGTSNQSWPIGWKLEKPIPVAVPKLVDFLNVEIKETPLLDVLNAIETKVDIPFVVDHLELSRRRIDLREIKVTIRPRRAMYKKVLDSVLIRNLLVGEVRADEAGKPFYWITTLKREGK